VNYLFLTVVLVIIFYPLIIVVSSSFSEPQAVISGKVWLFPVGLNFKGYQAVFRYQKIIMGFVNTIISHRGRYPVRCQHDPAGRLPPVAPGPLR
jgi:ABC-type glycerol-3-phosphate transport system permease component